MKTLMLILGCLILAALITPLVTAAANTAMAGFSKHGHRFKMPSIRKLQRACGLHAGLLQINGLTDGIHTNGVLGHLLSDEAITTRYLIVKRGSDSGHFAICDEDELPLGICLDEPSAAEESGAVQLLGGAGTARVVASEAIAVDADVYVADNGKVQNEPGTAGTYYKIGRAVTAGSADGDVFEIQPCQPQLTKIIANASTLAQTQAAMINGAVVIVLGA